MPRIAPNLRERVIGMPNANMATNEVTRVVGSSSRVIRNIRQRFQHMAYGKFRFFSSYFQDF